MALAESIVLPGSGGTITFKYDPMGRRIQKVSSAGTSNYIYVGPNVLEEVDTLGNVTTRYVPSLFIDEPLAQIRSGLSSYYEQDGQGSVTSLSNSSGALANTYTYDSFGNLNASTGTGVNPFRYTGRDYDNETGLYYYRARYYDQTVGRLLSDDDVDDGTSRYAYASNSPSRLVDPFGMQGVLGPNPFPNFAGGDLKAVNKRFGGRKEGSMRQELRWGPAS